MISFLFCDNFSCHKLASELNPGMDLNDLYFKMDRSNSNAIPSITKNFTQFDEKQVNVLPITATYRKTSLITSLNFVYLS